MKYQRGTFHSPHRLYWHPICTLTSINEECLPSVSQVYTSMDSHCKPNTEEPRAAKTHGKLNEILQTARGSQANSCFKATRWRTFKTGTLRSTNRLPFGNKSPPVGRGGLKHATKKKQKPNNKKNKQSYFNIQIHTDKLLSKNIFMFFLFLFLLLRILLCGCSDDNKLP